MLTRGTEVCLEISFLIWPPNQSPCYFSFTVITDHTYWAFGLHWELFPALRVHSLRNPDLHCKSAFVFFIVKNNLSHIAMCQLILTTTLLIRVIMSAFYRWGNRDLKIKSYFLWKQRSALNRTIMPQTHSIPHHLSLISSLSHPVDSTSSLFFLTHLPSPATSSPLQAASITLVCTVTSEHLDTRAKF